MNPSACEPIRPDDTALVVVDVQEKLWPVMHDKDALAANLVKLVRFAAIVDLPVIFMEQIKLGPVIAPVREAAQDVAALEKQTFDCFGCDSFQERLAQIKPRNLLITGIEAHICVLQTALSGLRSGHRVQVVADATDSRDPYHKDVSLSRVRHAGGVVTVVESAIFELLGRAGTDQFRATLPLVK